MIIAADFAEAANAIEASPSRDSLRSLDAVNLLLAGALSGFGPYVAVFLAEQKWTQQNIGFVLTAAGLAGLLTQLPAGELLDAVRSKRNVVALGALWWQLARSSSRFGRASRWCWPLWCSKGSPAGSWGWRSLPSALASSATMRWANASGAISVSPRREAFSRPASWASSAISCRIARYSWPPPRWCFRCSLLSATSSRQTFTSVAPAASRIIMGRAHRREHGAGAFGQTEACSYLPAACSCSRWPTRRCCRWPARRSSTAG